MVREMQAALSGLRVPWSVITALVAVTLSAAIPALIWAGRESATVGATAVYVDTLRIRMDDARERLSALEQEHRNLTIPELAELRAQVRDLQSRLGNVDQSDEKYLPNTRTDHVGQPH